MLKLKIFLIVSLPLLAVSLMVHPGKVLAGYCFGSPAGYYQSCGSSSDVNARSCGGPWCPDYYCGVIGDQGRCESVPNCYGWGSCRWCWGSYNTSCTGCSTGCGWGTKTCYDDSGCGDSRSVSCYATPPAAQSCPSSCHTNTVYVSNGSCGQTTCGSNAPAAQSCPTACHTDTQYVSNGACGQTTCGSNAPAAQSCPTTCHTDTQYVSNGACGQTTCGSNAPAAQSCPTTCHTDTQYVSNGACGSTTCLPNPPAAQSCPATCHTNTVYVPNGSCGSTTCGPNAAAAQACPTTCHTDTQYVPNGSCGYTTCGPNAPAGQSCPTNCGYTGGPVSNGACGQTNCPAIPPPAAQSCPITCHTDTQYVPNGSCGLITCPPNAGAAQTCPTACHTDTQYVSNGSCGTITCPPNVVFNDAGVVQSTSTINPGPLGNVSQGGCYPGYRTPNYTSVTDVVSVSYPNLLSTVLKNAGYNTTAALDATGCSLGITISTPNFNIYCYLVNIAGNFDAKLAAAIGDTTAGKTMILYPINNATGAQTVSTLENVPNNRKVIVFVNGDLLVNNNVLISAGNTGSGVVFVINGNLTTNPAVINLDGVYIFSGSFDDGASSTAITGRGSLLATGVNNILFNRSTATNVTSAEHWIYEPKYLVLFNQALAIPKYTWQELPPQ